jgi:predicted secreted protein
MRNKRTHRERRQESSLDAEARAYAVNEMVDEVCVQVDAAQTQENLLADIEGRRPDKIHPFFVAVTEAMVPRDEKKNKTKHKRR